MLLERYLRERHLGELKEVYTFWDSEGGAPSDIDSLVRVLHRHMTDEELVRKRLRFLSKKLVDLLKFLLKSDRYQAVLSNIHASMTFAYMSEYEVEAALKALEKRGFVFIAGPRESDGSTVFSIPRELGDILSTYLWDADSDLRHCLTLDSFIDSKEEVDRAAWVKAHLNGKVDKDEAMDSHVATKHLVELDEISRRRDSLSEENRRVFDLALWRHGGLLSRGVYDRHRPKFPKWDRKLMKETFEEVGLGTIRHLALGEYGVNHFDDTLILFEEVVASALSGWDLPERESVDSVDSLGVDFISDISSFLTYVSNTKIRLTLNGSVYRTAVKKVAERFILSKKAEFDEDSTFDLIHAFCTGAKLIQKKDDRSLSLTIKGRTWETMSLDKKLKMLLKFVSEEYEPSAEKFHTPKLRKLVLEVLGELPLDRWYDASAVSWIARNRYLASLDELGVRDAFQNRYQYSSDAGMRDVSQLGHMMTGWARHRLHLLGLVDLGLHAGKPVTLRLTMLGARALGRETHETNGVPQKPLVVNPDFEVIVFPDCDLYDLVCRLDRFCVRLKSDSTFHFQLTSDSVEKAVAQGSSASEILTVLSEHARADIPQNVIYSIREWADHVKFVDVLTATLLRARTKEVIDRMVQDPGIKPLIHERLAPTVVTLIDSIDLKELSSRLEVIGVFVDGNGIVREGIGRDPGRTPS